MSRIHLPGTLAATLTFVALALCGSLLAVGPASASVVSRPHSSVVQSTGGMVATSGNAVAQQGLRRSGGDWQRRRRNCRCGASFMPQHHVPWQRRRNLRPDQPERVYRLGYLHVQFRANAGPWNVDVYVGSRRIDHKSQNYAPHGSVSPKDAKRGSTFYITATHHATANNQNYGNVPNDCIIP